MERKNFVQVLESAGVDIRSEYRRLLIMFYEDHPPYESVADEVAEQFYKIALQLRLLRFHKEDFFHKT